MYGATEARRARRALGDGIGAAIVYIVVLLKAIDVGLEKCGVRERALARYFR